MAPQSVKLAGPNRTLVIQWTDGHVSAFPYQYLRDRCPCATCTGLPEYVRDSGETQKSPSLNALPIFGKRELKPDRAELVGRYALQIFWSDGHASGIYTFDYLRDLCPCDECVARRTARP